MRPMSPHEGRPGTFGPYGGRYVAETLVPALDELARATATIVPPPVSTALRLARVVDPGGTEVAELWLKREDLCHTGTHKINNALGQVLLARRMGKKRIIAETGAGQHGVATATVAARFGLECVVY